MRMECRVHQNHSRWTIYCFRWLNITPSLLRPVASHIYHVATSAVNHQSLPFFFIQRVFNTLAKRCSCRFPITNL